MSKIAKRNKRLAGLMTVASAISAFSGTPAMEVFAEDGGSNKDSGIADSTVEVSSDGTVTYGGDLATGADGSSWTKLISKYRFFIAGVSGIGAVSMILFFIINFMKLGGTSSNPQGRSSAIMGLVFSGLAAAGLGAVTFIVGIFFNAL